jgi:hypothetical protein
MGITRTINSVCHIFDGKHLTITYHILISGKINAEPKQALSNVTDSNANQLPNVVAVKDS